MRFAGIGVREVWLLGLEINGLSTPDVGARLHRYVWREIVVTAELELGQDEDARELEWESRMGVWPTHLVAVSADGHFLTFPARCLVQHARHNPRLTWRLQLTAGEQFLQMPLPQAWRAAVEAAPFDAGLYRVLSDDLEERDNLLGAALWRDAAALLTR